MIEFYLLWLGFSWDSLYIADIFSAVGYAGAAIPLVSLLDNGVSLLFHLFSDEEITVPFDLPFIFQSGNYLRLPISVFM